MTVESGEAAPGGSAIARGVSEAGAVGDRWLVGVVGAVSREVAVVRDSAKAAFRTTVRVVRRMHGGDGPDREPDVADGPADPEPQPREPGPAEAEAAAPAVREVHVEEPAPAGVVPALEALERIVSQHVETGGGGLRADARFWGLVALLQSLTAAGTPEPSTAEGGP